LGAGGLVFVSPPLWRIIAPLAIDAMHFDHANRTIARSIHSQNVSETDAEPTVIAFLPSRLA